MAARVIANLLVAGAGILIRAASQAYRQAIINGQRAGMTAENVSKAASRTRQMTLDEAYKILGLERGAPLLEVEQKYNHLFTQNEKLGSFYLQSKVHEAKERILQDSEPQS
eukprot:jgi/Botrbrau1/7060/Bobra.0165s0083.1